MSTRVMPLLILSCRGSGAEEGEGHCKQRDGYVQKRVGCARASDLCWNGEGSGG